jgi:hypothetical protein
MIKKLLPFSIFSLIFLSGSAFAQVGKDAKDSTSTVIIFNSGSQKSTKKYRSTEKNIIKIAPLGFVSGKIPISYERKINDFFSVQVSAGLTSKNYTRSIWQEALSESETTDEDIFKTSPLPEGTYDEADKLYDFKNRKAAIGYMFSVQPRLYINSEGMDGSFVALSADLYNYKYTIPGLKKDGDEYKHTGASKKEHETVQDIMGYFGIQRLYDNLSMEYTFGLGLRKIDGVKYTAGEDQNGKFYEGESTYSRSTLNLGVGFKVGYHF